MNRADERFVLVQPLNENGELVEDARVVVTCDGDTSIVKYSSKQKGYPVPHHAFSEKGACFHIQYGSSIFSPARIAQRVQALSNGTILSSEPLLIYITRPSEEVTIPLGSGTDITGRTMPNALYIAGFADQVARDSIVREILQELELHYNARWQGGWFDDERSIGLELDRGIKKIDSPILQYLRSTYPSLFIANVLKATGLKSQPFYYYYFTNEITVDLVSERVEAQKILDEFGLTELRVNGRTRLLAGDPGMGEGILEIVDALRDRKDVELVSVAVLSNRPIIDERPYEQSIQRNGIEFTTPDE